MIGMRKILKIAFGGIIVSGCCVYLIGELLSFFNVSPWKYHIDAGATAVLIFLFAVGAVASEFPEGFFKKG